MQFLLIPILLASALFARADIGNLLDATDQLKRCDPHNGLKCYSVRGTTVQGFVNETIEDDGFLANGQEVLIVPLVSGGSGGVFNTLLYTRSGHDPYRFVGYVPSKDGHLDVYLDEGRLIVVTPVYKDSDAQCCPSSRSVKAYTLDGIKLKLLESW